MCRSVRQRTALASCVHLSGRQTDTTGSGPYAHRRPWQCHPASGTPTPHTVASTGSTSVSCRCHLGRPHRFSILLQLSMFLQSRPPHHSHTLHLAPSLWSRSFFLQPTTSCSKFETVMKRRDEGGGGSGKRWCKVQSADRGEREKREGILFELACGGGEMCVAFLVCD